MSKDFYQTVATAETILSTVEVSDSNGALFYPDRWVALNEAYDGKELLEITILSKDEFGWKPKIQRFREKYTEKDVEKLLSLCYEGSWPSESW